jgi:hypothetical protein
MELDKQTETQSEAQQPTESLVDNVEVSESTPSETPTDEQELYVDDSSDDQSISHKTEMTKEQSYAAFQKKKKQSAKRKEEIEAGTIREKQLKDELAAAQATISDMTVGTAPTLEECDYDSDVHLEKVKEFVTKSQASKPKQDQSSNDDQSEFYLYEKEQALTKKVPNYEEAKTGVLSSLSNQGIDPEAGMRYLSNIARQKKVDIAKVVVAMDKMPRILEDILKAGENDFAVADILEAAANKVKTREKKQIDSKPEPEINNSGPIDNSEAAIAKAFKAWQKDPTLKNHKRYLKAKNN